MLKFLFLIISICPIMYIKLTLSLLFFTIWRFFTQLSFSLSTPQCLPWLLSFLQPKVLCLIIFCSPTLFVSLAIFSSQNFLSCISCISSSHSCISSSHSLSFFLQFGGSSLNYHFHCLPHNVYLDFCLFCNPKFSAWLFSVAQLYL